MADKKTISFRVSEAEYNDLKDRADRTHSTISELVREQVLYMNSSRVLTPDIVVTLTGIYNILCLDPNEWNKDMKKTVRNGLRRLHDVCKEN